MLITGPAGGKPTRTSIRVRGSSLWLRAWLVVLGILSLGMFGYLLSAYVTGDPALARVPVTNHQSVHYPLLLAHVMTAGAAIAVGWIQFWPWFRRGFPRIHRTLGRIYFFAGVFPAAVFAVPVALLSVFGIPAITGLLMMDLMWALTSVLGYLTARRRHFVEHRAWMIRSFALTISAPTARIWGWLAMWLMNPWLATAYHGDAAALTRDVSTLVYWFGWVVNVLIAEAYLYWRQYQKGGARQQGRVVTAAPEKLAP